MKRLFDFAVAAVMLVVLSPVIAIVAVVIKLTSKGPAIFAQTRVGWHEKPFKCLKFRTMQVDTPNVASHQASTAWITPVGRFLRKSKLDELPQLWNVLLGEMSLVGPRPCLPTQEELVAARRRLDVFSVRPGITGSAQLAGLDMSEPQRLAVADRQYVDERSFAGDIGILFNTALGKGSGDAAGR
ncbi:sugar transferase [Rhizobium sp. L1K21]|uniref:sugar transferase n=1 Tax=Rhizobium sp. L1K21 TaxID=2954933 RepID=UPI0020938F45|nr:sugar transferase [Rhizobium sp. L1K21]MCO6186620.1 sugar transferase [Rhizobium sp. L1K21]